MALPWRSNQLTHPLIMMKGHPLSRHLLSSLASALFLLGIFGVSAQAQTGPEILAAAPESDWVEIDPTNLIVMELPSGPMIIELQPKLAPAHVRQLRTLTQRGFYDGTIFHRVIEGFVAQGGDPTGTGMGDSDLPDIPGEFVNEFQNVQDKAIIGRDLQAAQIGFVGTVPVGAQAATLNKLLVGQEPAIWGLHCQGVMSMARAGDPNSANSQFFVLLADSRNQLDQGYTVWGKVVDGYENARRINRGEPPARPTPVVRARMMTQLPVSEQTKVEHLDPASDTFREYLVQTRRMTEDGYFDNICSIDVPVRINGELPE